MGSHKPFAAQTSACSSGQYDECQGAHSSAPLGQPRDSKGAQARLTRLGTWAALANFKGTYETIYPEEDARDEQ